MIAEVSGLIEKTMMRFGALAVGIMVLGFVGTVLKSLLLPKLKGMLGEAAVNRRLKAKLDKNIYHLIADIMLPTLSPPNGPSDGATTQIDHIVVSPFGVFVIETKNYKGWIFGNEKQKTWTQQIYRRKHKFQNPLRQNYKHTKTISDLMGIPETYLHSIVVFVGDSTFKTELPPNVVTLSKLDKYILSFQEPIIKQEQIPEIITTISAWANTLSNSDKRNHPKNLKKNHR